MSNEMELPFANRLSTITTEILTEADPYFTDRAYGGLQMLSDNLSLLNTEESGLDRRGKAIKLIANMGDRFSVVAGDTVALALVNTNLFRNWPDIDRRFLLDISLSRQMGWITNLKAQEETSTVYYGTTSDIGTMPRIERLQGLQQRLRERISPTPAHMRK